MQSWLAPNTCHPPVSTLWILRLCATMTMCLYPGQGERKKILSWHSSAREDKPKPKCKSREEGNFSQDYPACVTFHGTGTLSELCCFPTETPPFQPGCQGPACVKSCALQWIITLCLEDLSHWLKSRPDTELQVQALLNESSATGSFRGHSQNRPGAHPFPYRSSLWVTGLTPLNAACPHASSLMVRMPHGFCGAFYNTAEN